MIKKILSRPIDWVVYSLFNENQRKQIGDMLTQTQKDTVIRLLNGKKFTERRRVKSLKHHLYTLGFTERALDDMRKLRCETDNPENQRLISWEMSLWHANRNDVEGAQRALGYLKDAESGEESPDQKRRIAIVTAECLDRTGQKEAAVRLLSSHLEAQPHPDLCLGLANLEADIDRRMVLINEAFRMHELEPIGFADGSAPSYDALMTQPSADAITDGPKVSVILPAYKAGTGIRIAIESILGQTWRNLELIIVDDCSPDDTAAIAAEYANRDPRVRLLSTPENSGPYVARNIALEAADGEFVTVNDADDWSHSQKIEVQAKHLLAHPKVVANTSGHARLTEDLKLYRRGTPGKYIFPNMSSMMFRKETVMDKIGHWDSVRFAGDGEFKRRLVKSFGPARYVDMESGPLSLPRQSTASLTGSSAFGYDGFFMGVRKEYVDSLEHHHASSDNLYYNYPQKRRPFPVPEPMWPNREEKTDGWRNFDIVVAGDFRSNQDMYVKQIQKLKENHARIGLVQLYTYDPDDDRTIAAGIRDMLDGESLQMLVYGEKINAHKLIVTDLEVFSEWQKYRPEITVETLHITGSQQISNNQLPIAMDRMKEYFTVTGPWHFEDEALRAVFGTDRTEAVPHE